jgi:hypothetical protein
MFCVCVPAYFCFQQKRFLPLFFTGRLSYEHKFQVVLQYKFHHPHFHKHPDCDAKSKVHELHSLPTPPHIRSYVRTKLLLLSLISNFNTLQIIVALREVRCSRVYSLGGVRYSVLCVCVCEYMCVTLKK